MERWEIISGELEADLSRPLERLGFGRVFISDHRTASQLIFQREAARTVPKCAQPIILAYGICASAKISRHLVGVWLYAHCAKTCQRRLIALDPPINIEVSKES